jgi:hypothetical protein
MWLRCPKFERYVSRDPSSIRADLMQEPGRQSPEHDPEQLNGETLHIAP